MNISIPTREIAPAPTGKRNYAERRLTIVIADYLRLMAKPGVWWSHWPAGEYRSPQTAGLLARMGVNKGGSDFICIVPRGFFVAGEVKLEGTYQTPDQKAFQVAWEAAGGVYSVLRSMDDAVEYFELWGVTRADRSVSRPRPEAE